MESGSVERLAKNESFFRQVNERIKDVANGFEDGESYEFLCECSDPSCTARITLEPRQYEWVRASPTRFVLAPGHAAPQVEHVVEREESHEVVEKHGVAGHVATKLDPRGAES
jgi:hypothetical protein